MTETLGRLSAIKKYFQQEDALIPNGGRIVTPAEMKALSPESRGEIATLAAIELGVELDPLTIKA